MVSFEPNKCCTDTASLRDNLVSYCHVVPTDEYVPIYIESSNRIIEGKSKI